MEIRKARFVRVPSYEERAAGILKDFEEILKDPWIDRDELAVVVENLRRILRRSNDGA